ncbi:MAG: zf-HC2 domain-containing protein [Deltaproteobacteria bacterium]|nr:zf-HC2 domain-containing protein [Deltaproteobacteria bacterium]
MNHWMFNCKEVSQLVSEGMDRELPLRQRFLIRMHLLMCKYCSRFRSQLYLMRNVCRSAQIPPDDSDSFPALSQEALERIKRSFQKSSMGPQGQ